jgi:hypothetical protein
MPEGFQFHAVSGISRGNMEIPFILRVLYYYHALNNHSRVFNVFLQRMAEKMIALIY